MLRAKQTKILSLFRLKRFYCQKSGDVFGVKSLQPLKYNLSSSGYKQYALYFKGKYILAYGHQLVVLFFMGKYGPHLVINHKNGNKLDNRLCNLEVVTKRQNTIHAVKNGLVCRGHKIAHSKLMDADVQLIRKKLKLGGSPSIIAKSFGVNTRTIYKILYKETWGWLK